MLQAGAHVLPEVLAARERVARDFDAPVDWLNDGPTDLVTSGLPPGCASRLVRRAYGDRLVLHLLGRLDLICLKLYAYVDNLAPRHLRDLLAMAPTGEELEMAARWTRTHDDSEGYLIGLKGALAALGASDVAARIG